jgi:adhesin transport system outer membrane protein
VRLLSLSIALALYGFSDNAALASEGDDELLMFAELRHGAVKKPAPVVPAKPSPAPAEVQQSTSYSPPIIMSDVAPVPPVVIASQPIVRPAAAPLPTPPEPPALREAAAPVVVVPAKPSPAPVEVQQSKSLSPQMMSNVDPVRPEIIASQPIVRPADATLPKPPEPPAQRKAAAPVVSAPLATAVVDRSTPQSEGVSLLNLRASATLPGQRKPSRAELENSLSESEVRALFSQAVMQALSINPKIHSSRSQADAAKESIDEAKGQRWPQVNVTSNSKGLNFGSGYRQDNDNKDPVSLNFNMATTLYDFGQTSNTIKTREAQAEAATLTISAESESTAWDVTSALTELSKQRLVIAVSQDFVARMKELTKMLQGIVAVDQGRKSELTQATGRLLSAQSQLDAAVAKARDTEIILQRLLGESSITLPPSTQWNLRLPDPQSQLSMVESHPTVLKARADKQAAEHEAAVVRASGLPTFSWVVSKNTGQDELGRRQAYETGIQASWGLFRGGSTRAAERAALARAEASSYLVEDQQRDLEQRIRAANQDASSLLERAVLYHSLAAETNRIRVDFFDQWYHLGKRTLLDVLSSETDYYNNRVSEVSSRFDGYAAIIRSYASSGTLISWLNNHSI